MERLGLRWRKRALQERPHRSAVGEPPHPGLQVPLFGETTFHFVDATPEQAVEQAKAAADGGDVRIGGGVATLRRHRPVVRRGAGERAADDR